MKTFITATNASTMTSREIAELVGSRHDKVKQSIERLSCKRDINGNPAPVIALPSLGEYLDTLGRRASEYLVCKRDSFVVVAQLSPEFTAKLVDRWQELESRNLVTLPDFTNPAIAARAWADQLEATQAAKDQLALAAPKAAFVDQYVEAGGSMSFRQVAKLLSANERQLRQLLLDNHVMYYLGGVLTPYQPHIEAGRFEVKTGTCEHNNHAFSQSRFTAKGVQWIAGQWAQFSMQGAA